MTYDYSAYWRALHQAHPGSLKAVGHPWLSEALNQLKYASEAATLFGFLNSHRRLLTESQPVQVLDVGAGTGFWSELLQSWFVEQGLVPQITVADISEQALAQIRARHPEVQAIHVDITTVDPSRLKETYSLVGSFYCLHHLPRIADFSNGLQFASRSVARGGILLLMDPVLTRPYSSVNGIVFSTYQGNGIPRPLNLIDDVLDREGLDRIAFLPAVSFVLNGCFEARSRMGAAVTSGLWNSLQRLYRSEGLTRALSGVLRGVDAFLKNQGIALSSSLMAYRKRL